MAEREGFEPSVQIESLKSRRLRKLHGIRQFRILRETVCSPVHTLTVRFRESSRGEALAIVRLNCDLCRRLPGGQMGSHLTACLACSPARKMSLQGCAQRKLNKWSFSKILSRAAIYQLIRANDLAVRLESCVNTGPCRRRHPSLVHRGCRFPVES